MRGIFATAPVWALALLTLTGLFGSHARAEKLIPTPPYYYVLDEPHALNANTTHALQTLLIEHDRVTSEQFIIAIFNSLEDEDLVAYTNRVFSTWRIGQRGKNNGVLLALFWKEHKARIEVGYGLEPTLTDAKSKDVLSDILIPELKNGNPDRAVTLAALQILTILDSPLVQNGKAQEIIRSGGFQGSTQPTQTRTTSNTSLWFWILIGFFFLRFALRLVTAGDAHYTGRGWYRPRPSIGRSVLLGGLLGGFGRGGGGGGGFGGFGGGGGGFGGFGGGGGFSGGGGASGSW